MKIVLWGNFLADYCSENHYAKSLESLGHEVIRLQETEVPTNRVLTESLRAQMLLWVHSHGVEPTGWPVREVLAELQHAGVPSVAYHLDLYKGIPARWAEYRTHPYLSVDHFFTVDAPMLPWFTAHSPTGTRGHYLPAGVYHGEAKALKPKDPFDVAFVGSRNYHKEWPHRAKLVEFLEKTYGKRFHHYGPDSRPVGRVVRGLELNQVYADARITVGDSFCPQFRYRKYWSDRVYETLGRGGFLLHPKVPGMDEVFTDKEHLVFYEFGNFRQLRSLIEHYLKHDDEREEIRAAGHQLVVENHTYRHRLAALLDTVTNAPPPVPVPKKKPSAPRSEPARAAASDPLPPMALAGLTSHQSLADQALPPSGVRVQRAGPWR